MGQSLAIFVILTLERKANNLIHCQKRVRLAPYFKWRVIERVSEALVYAKEAWSVVLSNPEQPRIALCSK